MLQNHYQNIWDEGNDDNDNDNNNNDSNKDAFGWMNKEPFWTKKLPNNKD